VTNATNATIATVKDTPLAVRIRQKVWCRWISRFSFPASCPWGGTGEQRTRAARMKPTLVAHPLIFAGAFRCHIVGMALNFAQTVRLVLHLLQVGRESLLVLAFGFGFAFLFLRRIAFFGHGTVPLPALRCEAERVCR
jgi:hypothetical protein